MASLSLITPSFHASSNPEAPSLQKVIDALGLQPHVEGGYFVETDRDPLTIPSPFDPSGKERRSASTTIYYLITPKTPQGAWHRNKGRTVHTLHWGRGQYVLIHADEHTEKKRIETFIVGKDVTKGEKLQWIVEGGKYKASFLLPDVEDKAGNSNGLLISEVSLFGC
jgi:predicted cupin superfamily sugar epimerase